MEQDSGWHDMPIYQKQAQPIWYQIKLNGLFELALIIVKLKAEIGQIKRVKVGVGLRTL